MAKYKIVQCANLERCYEVEADSLEQAEDIVANNWSNNEQFVERFLHEAQVTELGMFEGSDYDADEIL